MNSILENILKKMCKFNGLNFKDFSWNDDKHLLTMSKYPDGEKKFEIWLSKYMRGLKISELRNIVDYPYTYYKKKKSCEKFAASFTSLYGFKTYKENLAKSRLKKLKKIKKRLKN